MKNWMRRFKRITAVVLAVLMMGTMANASALEASAAGEACAETNCTGTYDSNGFCTEDGTHYEAPEKVSDAHHAELATTHSGYYAIENAGHLFWFAAQVDGGNRSISAVLTADIDLNPGYTFGEDGTVSYNGETVTEGFRSWLAPGVYAKQYKGTLDGMWHTIRGLYCTESIGGLIAFSQGTITRLGLTNGYLFSDARTARLGSVVSQNQGTVSYCWSKLTVKVTGHGSSAGGIVCLISNNAKVSYCYNLGKVIDTGTSGYVGGIVGSIGNNGATIKNCYNYGTVTGNNLFGGILGADGSGTTEGCFYRKMDGLFGIGSTTEDDTAKTAAVTASEFSSGALTWKLNSGKTDGTQIWYQTVGVGYPGFSGPTVYMYSDKCYSDESAAYANIPTSNAPHSYENGFCTAQKGDGSYCGAYEPATWKEEDNRYEIANAGQLYWFATQINEGTNNLNAILTENIVVNEALLTDKLTVTGSEATIKDGKTVRNWIPMSDYAGTFDGNGKYISGLYVREELTCRGFVGTLSGTVQNLTIQDSYIRGEQNVGTFAGAVHGTIINCHSKDNVVVASSYTSGGISGSVNAGGKVADCTNSGKVYTLGVYRAGGIVGWNMGDIVNCHNTGVVTGIYYNGGIAGAVAETSSIKHCSNRGEVISGTSKPVGGIIGLAHGTVLMENCFVTNGQAVLGQTDNSTYTISNCYTTGGSFINAASGYEITLSFTNCYYVSGEETENYEGLTSITQEDVTSGKLTWLLNGEKAEGIWKQTLDGSATPGFSGETVYFNSATEGYTNAIAVLRDGVFVSLTKNSVSYGEALSVLEFNDAVFVDSDTDTVLAGTLGWKDASIKPEMGTTSATWIFIPDNGDYAAVEGTVAITVNKATPEVMAVPTVTDRIYNPSVALIDNDITGGTVQGVDGNSLAGTWNWQTSGVVPVVNNSGYVAVFTPDDSVNYETVTRTITVNVAKATPYIASAQSTAITYGESLSASTVSGGAQYSESDNTKVDGSFAWADASVKPVVADSNSTVYKVVFTPSDSTNYNSVNTTAKLTVNKAQNAPNMPTASMKVAYSNKTVGAVTLPDGWKWQDADKERALEVGTPVTATAVYTGADKGNYKNTTVSITVTRKACAAHVAGNVLYTGKDEKAPTCTESGLGHKECTKCGMVMESGIVVKATGHDYSSKVTTEATTDKEGVRTYTCDNCGDSYTESIPKLPKPTPTIAPVVTPAPEFETTVVQGEDGNWYSYINGAYDPYYTGLAQLGDAWWMIVNGKIDFTYTSPVFFDDDWWFVRDGLVEFDYNGLVFVNDDWWYVVNGRIDFGFNGLAFVNDAWWYVSTGRIDFSYTGLIFFDDDWWFVQNGCVNFGYTGLAFINNDWWYVVNGRIDFSYCGLFDYDNQKWYVQGGKIDFSYNNVYYFNDIWWYIETGKVNFGYNGLAYTQFNDKWWYVIEGVISFDYTGAAFANEKWWYVERGEIDFQRFGKVTIDGVEKTVAWGEILM